MFGNEVKVHSWVNNCSNPLATLTDFLPSCAVWALHRCCLNHPVDGASSSSCSLNPVMCKQTKVLSIYWGWSHYHSNIHGVRPIKQKFLLSLGRGGAEIVKVALRPHGATLNIIFSYILPSKDHRPRVSIIKQPTVLCNLVVNPLWRHSVKYFHWWQWDVLCLSGMMSMCL